MTGCTPWLPKGWSKGPFGCCFPSWACGTSWSNFSSCGLCQKLWPKQGTCMICFRPGGPNFTRKIPSSNAQHQRPLASPPCWHTWLKTICVPAAAHLDQCHSFLAMVEALEMLQATQLGQVQPPMLQHLWQPSVYMFAFVCIQYMFFQSKTCFHACKCDVRQAIENALDLFKEANGEAMMLRKHHWMLHLATHLQLWGFLPNCWSLERKHKTIMMFANQTKKLTGFSLSLLEECLAHWLVQLAALTPFGSRGAIVEQACSQFKIPWFSLCCHSPAAIYKGPGLDCNFSQVAPWCLHPQQGFCSCQQHQCL